MRRTRRTSRVAAVGGCGCSGQAGGQMRRRAGVADAVGPRGGRRAQRSSSQRRTVELPAGQSSSSGRRSPPPLRRPSSQLSTAALPSKGARLLGWRHRCVVGPRGALSIALYLEEAGGRRLFPVLLQEAVAGVKTPKVSCRSRWRFFAGTSADGLTILKPAASTTAPATATAGICPTVARIESRSIRIEWNVTIVGSPNLPGTIGGTRHDPKKHDPRHDQ
jgi:hypothetical protein